MTLLFQMSSQPRALGVLEADLAVQEVPEEEGGLHGADVGVVVRLDQLVGAHALAERRQGLRLRRPPSIWLAWESRTTRPVAGA